MKEVVILLILAAHGLSQVIITKFIDEEDYNLTNPNTDKNKHNDNLGTNPDKYLDTAQIIRRNGYRSEAHIVETSDGYLLTIHRIPVNKNGKVGNQPVLLQHGLLSSSADWVITGNKSLAFTLSDLEYDVWLGNARGSTYSKGHVSLSPDSEQFWNFSFHEMAVKDLPAVLSYISNVTNKEGEIIYIGHSMGTTMFFSFASLLPKIAASTVKMMVGLAPVAYLTHIQSPLRYLAPWANDYQWLAKHLGLKQFLPNDEVMKLLTYGCEVFNIDKKICKQVIFAVCGFDAEQFEEDLLPVILAHDPAGSSTKTIIHYAQLIQHGGDFMQYDYGEKGNIIQYGTPTPPPYNLSNIEVPLYFMYGDNDWLCSEVDVKKLSQAVSKTIGLYNVPFIWFNHVDFIWAKDAPELVYKNLIETIKKQS